MASSSSEESENCLHRPLPGCCGRCMRRSDLFKFAVPVGWIIIIIMAVLAYLISPVLRGARPRYGTALLVSFSGIPGVGASLAVFHFLRYDALYNLQDQAHRVARSRKLKIHSTVALLISILALGGAAFFATIGPDLDLCAHETCGADVSWCLVSFTASAVWWLCLGLAFRYHRREQMKVTGDQGDTVEMMDSI